MCLKCSTAIAIKLSNPDIHLVIVYWEHKISWRVVSKDFIALFEFLLLTAFDRVVVSIIVIVREVFEMYPIIEIWAMYPIIEI